MIVHNLSNISNKLIQMYNNNSHIYMVIRVNVRIIRQVDKLDNLFPYNTPLRL